MMSKEKRRVPKLRFPGFTEDWEQRKADYIFKSVTDKGYPELPVLSASQELGMVYRDQNGIDIQHDKKNETSYKRVLPGQFVIHLRSFQGGFAYSEIEGITSPAYTVMSFKNSSEQYGLFWKHVFKSETFIKRLETITYGIRDGRSISFSDFKSLVLQYPSLSEQKLIGDLITIIEKGIILHQRKLDNLKLKKKALLQKLFPKNGERYPELRFPGFTDAWEQRKFSDLYEKISEKNDLSYSLDKIISVANMYYKSDAKVSNEEYLRTYNIFRYGEIAFEGNKSKDFAYGRFVENTIGDGIISHVFEVFRPIVKYDIYFWKYYINYEPIMGKILSRCTKKTTMMTNLVAKDFLKETVLVPTLTEQKQIGTLLNTLDKFITLHQQEPFLCVNSVNGGVELC